MKQALYSWGESIIVYLKVLDRRKVSDFKQKKNMGLDASKPNFVACK